MINAVRDLNGMLCGVGGSGKVESGKISMKKSNLN